MQCYINCATLLDYSPPIIIEEFLVSELHFSQRINDWHQQHGRKTLPWQLDKSLYTVLSVCFPPNEDNDMMLFHLDLHGISASGGSACSSGAMKGSHVLSGIGADPSRASVRFSFSKFNTKAEVDIVIEKLKEIVPINSELSQA